MRKLLSIALVLLCCKNMYSQSAGWQWVDNKEAKNWGAANTSIVNDNNCNLYSLSLYQQTNGDTLISKFSKDGKCIGAAVVPQKKVTVISGEIKIQDSLIKCVVVFAFNDTLIFGKDTILPDYPSVNRIILYIELAATDLSYIKAKKIVRVNNSFNSITTYDFEIINNSIIIEASFNYDSLIFCDNSSYVHTLGSSFYWGVLISYDTKNEKIEWKKIYHNDSSSYIKNISKKADNAIILGFSKNDVFSPYYNNFAEIIDPKGKVLIHHDFNNQNAQINKIISNNSHIYLSGQANDDTVIINNKIYSITYGSFFIAELDNKLNTIWIKFGTGKIVDMIVDKKNIVTVLGEFGNTLQYQNYRFQNPFIKQYHDADFEMFFMRLDSVGNLKYIEHHEVPFHHHAIKISANENDIFFSGTFHYETKPYTTYFGNIPIFIDTGEYNYVARYTVSKLFFNIYLGTCKDSIIVEHDPEYTTFNWFLNDTIYIGSGEKIKWNTNYPPGKYNIKVVASGAIVCDAEYKDTLTYVNPLPPVDIGSDTSMCIHDSLVLKANIIGNYTWNTHDTTANITIKKAGKYFVTVYDSAKCFVSDSIIVNYFPQQKLNLGRDFSYCIDSGLPQLDVAGYKYYLWSTGETSSSIQIKDPAQYSLLVTDSFNCKQYDTIEIAEVCPPKVYVPNSFTPNGDGLNDIFKPSASFVEKYTLTIYNKWGELIYTGTEKDEGWNGKYRNTEAKEDIYIWLLTWTGKRDVNYDINGTQQGTVTLIRKAK